MVFSPKKRKSGFTLVELLAALAIIAVVLAIAIPSVSSIQRNLSMEDLDATARQIFAASQNRLTSLRSSGLLQTVGGINLPAMPQDFDDEAWDWAANGGDYYYLTKSGADALLPAGTLDDATEAGYYIIEYNAKTGSVYGVFYSKSPIDYDDILALADRTYEYRRDNGASLGYYGAAVTLGTETEQALAPGISLVNGEELYLEITPVAGKDYTYTVSVEGSSGSKRYSFSSGMSADVLNNGNITYGDGDLDGVNEYTVVLDSLADGLHFSQLFLSSEGFVPGEDITVTVTASTENGSEIPVSVSATANSLFARRSGGAADISNCRHLQNLAPSVSNVSVTGDCVTSAVQTGPIDWDAAGSAFRPITNSALTAYDGCGNVIVNLAAVPDTGGAYAGLFGFFGGSAASSITDVRLVNVSVAGGSAAYVGALAGRTSNTAISGCMVYAVPAELTALTDCAITSAVSGTSANYVGGLVGYAAGGSVSDSMASVPLISVSAANSGTAPYVGGLLGYSDAAVSRAYANTGEIAVSSSTLTANVGGFAGGLDGGSTDCYAMGAVSASGRVAAGGFAGVIGNFDKDYVNIYSGMSFSGSGTNVTLKGFASSAGALAGFTNCYCLTGTGYGETGVSAVSAVTTAELASCQTAANWTGATAATTVPYTLTGTYPYPRLAVMSHYGDWNVSSVVDTPFKIAYYEIYKIPMWWYGGSYYYYQIGFYSEDIAVNSSGDTLDTLLDESDYTSLVSDGYAVMFEKDSSGSTSGGISYSNLTNVNARYSYQIWNRNGTVTTQNQLRKPSQISVNGWYQTVYYLGSVLSDGRVLTYNGTGYYPLFLSYAQVVDDSSSEATFYQKLTIGLNASGNGTTGATTYDLYYNPHVAKSPVSVGTAPSESGITAYIRTERQYATLASSGYSRYWNKGVTFVQERDLNYSSNQYSYSYLDQWVADGWIYDTLSIGSAAAPFDGTYDGGGHTIKGLTIAGGAGYSNLGMFGYTAGAAIEDLTLDTPAVNGSKYTNVSNAGCLVGYCSDTAISDVTIEDGSVYGRYRIGAAAGTLADSCSVSGLTINGGTVTAVRLGGVFGQSLCTSAGASQTVQSVSVTDLSVSTNTGETSGLTAIYGSSFGLSAFIGDVSSGSSASVSISDIGLSECTVTLDSITGTYSAEHGALFVGTVCSENSGFSLSFGSGISIEDCTLNAKAARSGDAFGAVIGQITSSTAWSMTAPSVTVTDTTLSRSSANSTSGNEVGGYIGAVINGGGTLTVLLPAALDLSDLGYSWSTNNYGSNIGGCIGYVGSGTVIDSSSASGTVVRHGGSATTLNTDGGTAGGFAGYSAGTVSNISVRNVRIIKGRSAFAEAGGFVGVIAGGSVTKCDARLETGYTSITLATAGNAGGFAGRISGSAAVSYCFGSQDVTATRISLSGTYYGSAGGFAAVIESGSVTNSYASGDASGASATGGFAGAMGISGNAAFPTAVNCYSAGNVDGGGYVAGGFVGRIYGGSVTGSYSVGSVSDLSNGTTLGGFVGSVSLGAPSAYSSSKPLFSNVAYMHGGLTIYNTDFTDYSYSSYYSTVSRLTISQFRSEALSHAIFPAMTSAASSHPYSASLTTFGYPALSGVGCGIADAQHWGDWAEYEEITVGEPSNGSMMGVFYYERVYGTAYQYKIVAAGVNYNYYTIYNPPTISIIGTDTNFLNVTVNLQDYTGVNSLGYSGFGIFWDADAITTDYMFNNTKVSQMTLSNELGLSDDYLFYPIGAQYAPNQFNIKHDNNTGHDRNLYATYYWNNGSRSFYYIDAEVR